MADRNSFDTDTAHLRPGLLAHCYRMMGSAADAEDLVQETYLRAWRGWADFDGRSSASTWMYRLATNACLNALSSAGRRILPTHLSATPGDPTAPLREQRDAAWIEPLPEAMLWTSAQPTPEENLLARENITLAWAAALQELSPNQRAVLLLRDVLGFSASETATTLGTSTASVNSALQRSRARIGDGLAEPPAADEVAESRAVRAFIEAFERHDYAAVVAALADDMTWQMPPFDAWFRGAEAAAQLSWTHCPARASGDLRYLPTRSNGQPAVGMYLRKGTAYEAFQFQVLSVEGGRVGGVTGWFTPHTFRLAGLPTTFDAHERPHVASPDSSLHPHINNTTR